jgi:lipopolysaccharide export system protein LptA
MKLRLLLALFVFPLIASAQKDAGNQNTVHLGFQADFMRPAYPSYLNGRQVHKHEGNVVYTHKTNGATINCDSAYHYFPSDTIEFFGNVVVQHETTVLYGEKIFYDGIFAKVRGRLVKMNDIARNATLKTQFVDYNIDRNVGTYAQGGTLERSHDTIESANGIFDGNTGIFTFINDVAMKNDSIILACDTMLYDTRNDITTFIGNTKTWSSGNIMLSDYGIYKPNENEMSFSSDVYIQSETQEVWADSVWFNSQTKNADLFRNIQMTDTSQNTIVFGDKARISDNYQTVFVTEKPAALYYTVPKEANQLSDTTYLTADTICSLMENIKIVIDTIMEKDTTVQKNIVPDSLNIASATDTAVHDSAVQNIVVTDTAEHENIDRNKMQLDIRKSFGIDIKKKELPTEQDSIKQILVTRDTAVRSIFAYHSVKIYKSDFQALCDSLVYHSLDSTTYMHHLPVLWNDSTQITSGVATFYNKNGQIDYAEFSPPAMVIMREDSAHFSQLKGKSMKAFFNNNQMDKIHVLGNGQSIYYIREKPEQPISAVEVSECANIIIKMMQIDGKSKINRVTYLMKPASNTYPLDKIPEDSKQLKGFALHDDIRPKSKDELFDRQVRRSQRHTIQMLEKPAFKITSRINKITGK